jgi:Carboxypeptidase regulatory-like domain
MMSSRLYKVSLSLFAALLLVQGNASGQKVSAPAGRSATVVGTVLDVNGGVVPDAAVILSNSNPGDRLDSASNGNGFFQFTNVPPGKAWHVSVREPDFAAWTSKAFALAPGQYFLLTGIEMRLAMVEVSVTALTPEEIATTQVRAEEHQRILGVIPNFYVVYDRNPAPLTPRLKFQLALRALRDPVTIAGFVLNSTIYQAAGYPAYRGGITGYGQRLASTFAGGYANVIVGDAVLPTFLHQDPRFHYRGTGTARSRLLYALSNPILTYGDNGRRQINFSGIGGDLASGALADTYYPSSGRGGYLILKSTLIGAGGRIANGLLQEFILKRRHALRGGRE